MDRSQANITSDSTGESVAQHDGKARRSRAHFCSVQLLGCLYENAAALHITDGGEEHELRRTIGGRLQQTRASFAASQLGRQASALND